MEAAAAAGRGMLERDFVNMPADVVVGVGHLSLAERK
jgi:hypothetical protein